MIDKKGHAFPIGISIPYFALSCKLKTGASLSKIAKELGRSKATISRELRRNSQKQAYMPVIAQKKYTVHEKSSFGLAGFVC